MAVSNVPQFLLLLLIYLEMMTEATRWACVDESPGLTISHDHGNFAAYDLRSTRHPVDTTIGHLTRHPLSRAVGLICTDAIA
jgi:hypothetical protein